MSMTPGYTPPPNTPQIDPATGLPVPPTNLGGQPFQAPPGSTINVTVPPAPGAPDPNDPEAPISRAQMEEILNAERERVCKEEKDKLYPKIAEQEDQLKILNEEREQRIAAETAEQQRLAEETRLAQEAEMSAKDLLEQSNTNWEQRFADMQADRDRERAAGEKERQFGQLQAFRGQRIAEESEGIAPQFRDYITGKTSEEIEASIATAKAKTAEIVAEFQQAGLNNRRTNAPPIAGSPPVDPTQMTGEQQTRELTAAEIRDMSMEEYGQYRSQLLSAGSQRVREQGVYAP